MLRSGVVSHVCAYVAPKLIGGKEAKSPVGGLGIQTLDQAAVLTNPKISRFGDDLLLEYDVKGGFR